jgi:hypothetical protein
VPDSRQVRCHLTTILVKPYVTSLLKKLHVRITYGVGVATNLLTKEINLSIPTVLYSLLSISNSYTPTASKDYKVHNKNFTILVEVRNQFQALTAFSLTKDISFPIVWEARLTEWRCLYRLHLTLIISVCSTTAPYLH